MLEPSNLYVEKVCLSLVREYVIRRNFQRTLVVLNDETAPLNPKLGFYSSRLHLGQDLGMEGLMRVNKGSHQPLRSMLEVLVKCFLQDRELLLRSTFANSCYYRSSRQKKKKKKTNRREKKVNGKESGLIPSSYTSSPPPLPPCPLSRTKRDMSSQPVRRHSETKPGQLVETKSLQKRNLQKVKEPTQILGPNDDDSSDEPITKHEEPKLTTNYSRNSLSLEGSRDSSAGGDDDYDREDSWIPEESKSRSTVRLEHSVSLSLVDRRSSSLIKPSDRTSSEGKGHSIEGKSHLLLGQHMLESKQNLLAQVSLSRAEDEIRQQAQDRVESVTPSFLSNPTESLSKNSSQVSKSIKNLSSVKSTHDKKLSSGLRQKSPTPSSSASSVKSTTVTTDQGFKIRDVDSLETPTKSGSQTISSNTSASSTSTSTISSEIINKAQHSHKFMQKSSVSSELVTTRSTVTKTLDQATWQKLKLLVLGERGVVPEGWTGQGFGFNCNIPYALVQKKGGPCGVLAAVQAMILRSLMFGSAFCDPNELPVENFDLTCDSSSVGDLIRKRSLALIGTLTEILWRCGTELKDGSGGRTVTVGLTSRGVTFGPGSELRLIYNVDGLKNFIEANLYRFDCIGLVFSAALSREVDRVQDDMDFGNSPLLGQHGYCTQELMNLLLMGQAISNAFDHDVVLDEHRILKGISAHSDIGLLSLFEHYNSCKVGSFLKNPKFPLWIVCSESHFSVLFSDDMELTAKPSVSRIRLGQTNKIKSFDLFYYDGLARQEKIIRLTITPSSAQISHGSEIPEIGTITRFGSSNDDDLIPPLEKCIRTKWKDAEVDWNETEPIL